MSEMRDLMGPLLASVEKARAAAHATRVCMVHGGDCPNEVVRDLMPDGYTYGNYCWDGYAVLCDRDRAGREADVEAAISESHAAAEAYESYQSEGGEAW